MRIWSHLLKKSLMENFIFCAVIIFSTVQIRNIFRVLVFVKHQQHILTLREQCPNMEFFLVRFPVCGLNTGKYRPKKTPSLDTFHALFICKLPTNCLSVFDHFKKLTLKALSLNRYFPTFYVDVLFNIPFRGHFNN